MMCRLPIRPFCLASLAALSACAVVGGPSRETVLRIDPRPPAWAASPGREVIALAPVQALASASGRRYTYIDPSAPREVRFAATLFWEEPPPAIVTRAVADGLSARLGAPVIVSAVGLGATRRLTVELDRFEEISGPSARAVVAVHATLADLKAHALVFSAPFCRSAQVQGVRPTDRSRAFESALNGLLDDIAAAMAVNVAAPGQARGGGATPTGPEPVQGC